MQEGSDTLPLSFLDIADPKQIQSLSAHQLKQLIQEVVDVNKVLKKRKRVLDEGLQLKYMESAVAALQVEGRDTGVIHLKDGPYTITIRLPKKVTWNQEKLAEIIPQLSLVERAQHVKTTYTIEERKYTNWSGTLKTFFKTARTVKPKKPRFKIIGAGK